LLGEAGGGAPDGVGRVDSALAAIASPTRRAVLELLRGEPRTVTELTDALPMTQSAVSQHMAVLRDAGLVTTRQAGRRRLYSVDLDGLGEVRAWVDRFWDDVLDAFVAHTESLAVRQTPTDNDSGEPSTLDAAAGTRSPGAATSASTRKDQP
jgi:DNA-binding transcriptional ArsR family regulator